MIDLDDFSLKSWVRVAPESHFPIQNLPFGIFKPRNQSPRVGVAIGAYAVDLSALMELGHFNEIILKDVSVFHADTLNDLISEGKSVTHAVRNRVGELLSDSNPDLRDSGHVDQVLHLIDKIELLMPVRIGDYTDFYSSEQHAYNVGVMFRDPANALLPNWKHLPVGYHGRSSSIVISGTPLYRPMGQTKPDELKPPVFGPSKQVDFELEMAFVVGKDSQLGKRISTSEAEEYIFGMLLFNDWSARDIQKWEYVPLGPFLAKNFGSSISPWVVTMEALKHFKTDGPVQKPEVLPYLKCSRPTHYDIHLEVGIATDKSNETVVCKSNYKNMYWNMAQQLAHHTVNGCNVRVGDLIASGTISGKEEDSFGSMLELAWKGTKPIALNDGSTRTFINDHDTVIMRGYAEKSGVKIGFGEVRTEILPAL